MILMWKFPPGVNIDDVRMLRGTEGSYLNPIQDAKDNWVVSDEEYCAQEFQYFYHLIFRNCFLIRQNQFY